MTVQLRPYQTNSIDALRSQIAQGKKKPILFAPAGSGKTEIACALILEAIKKGSRCAFIVDRVSLVDQTSERFGKYGISHGVMQASHWNWNPMKRVQICSAQTIEKRKGFNLSDFDLVIVDECHCMRKFITAQIQGSETVTIGLTATPFTKGLGQVYNGMVNLVTTNELIAQEFLTPLKVYMAKAFDVSGMKIVAGEWSADEIANRGTAIIGDIVETWEQKVMEHFGEQVKTIVFAATVDHGAKLVAEFQAKGYDFRQISYKDGDDDARRAVIEEFRRPDSTITGLVSCEVFTKGFDVPDVKCGISARPYRKSLSSHIQQLGRVMRTAEGKDYGLWLDHSGNYMRFYEDTEKVFESGLNNLDMDKLDSTPRKEPEEAEKTLVVCSCGYVLKPSDDRCPQCGKERRRKVVELLPGEVGEVVAKGANRNATWDEKANFMGELKAYEMAHGYKGGWAAHKYRAKYGVWPNDPRVKNAAPRHYSPEVANWIRSQNIRWAKSRKSA